GLPWTESRRRELLRSRVALTQELVAWIGTRTRRPRCLLSASAIGYYGVQPLGDDTPLGEDSPPQPVFMSQLCHQWEQAAAAAVPLGVAVACLRFGLVLGRGGALPMLLLPVRLGLGGRLGSGRQWLSWVHIDDLLRALAHAWRALEQETTAALRVYNVTAPEAVRQADFSRTAAAVLHRPNFMPTPAWPVRLLLGEQADLLLEGQRVAPLRLQREGFVFRHPALQPALQELVGGRG
ncbi:MAG TPA: TIGR01777 family oxidoreductase, partial [Rubrivivax sp.]|nr:TIGR01777 family oxidoreductase [Rubrivivax sp.]